MKKILLSISMILLVTGLHAQTQFFLSNISSSAEGIDALPKAIKIAPSSAYASSYQGGENIEKAIDGNESTIYHSNWSTTTFPVTLRFEFADVDEIDYLIYCPRKSGSNGNFKEFEVWYTTEGGSRTKLGDFDFKGSGSDSRINFPTTLVNPTRIEFIVKSGTGNFVSCAEMKFYAKNPEEAVISEVFADALMTTLKPDVTMEQINQIPNAFIREVASDIYAGRYSLDYRVADFRSYMDRTTMSKTLKVSAYNKYENPTGIYFSLGKHVLVAENIPFDKTVSLVIPDYKYTEGGGSLKVKSFPLSNGLNVIDVTAWDGLGYISYFTENPEQDEPVSVHFMKGYVHGYFDITKNDNDDWNALLENATKYPVMDAVGRRCHIAYPVEAYRTNAWGQGVELVNNYDTLIAYQQRILGWEKYNKVPDNRVLVRINYNYFMYKDDDGATYEVSTMPYVSSPTRMLTENWGITHEIGHIHQYGFNNWHGMGEVSVNFPNLIVAHRLLNSPTNGNYSPANYDKAYASIVATGTPHLKYEGEGTIDHNFGRLVPFGQLYFYFSEIGNDDFYPDLNEALRNTTDDTSGWGVSDYELNFVKKACEVSQLNLIPFFEKWGFLYYTDSDGREPFSVGDYGGQRTYSLAKAKVDALKAEIAAKGYPEPSEDISLVKPYGGRIQ